MPSNLFMFRVLYLMNLDYRKGSIDFTDLNSDNKYNPTSAFTQSQLANMLTVLTLSKDWAEKNISVNAVYPGVCATNIKRHMGVDKSISGNLVANPIMWLLTRSPDRGAQTVLWAATGSELVGLTGKLFSNMKEIEVECVGEDMMEQRKKMRSVSMYWTGLQEKQQFKS